MLLINLIGYMAGNVTGYGAHTRGFWHALNRLQSGGLQCLFTEFGKPGEVEANAKKCQQFPGRVVNIWCQVGPGEKALAQFPGEKVAYTMFETDALPDGWVAGLSRADRVFTPSAWGRQVMIDNGIKPGSVHVVPGGIERALFTPWGSTLPQLQGPAFRFLMVGAYQARKGYPELFAAFRQAFGDRSDVELVIKANSFSDAAANERLRADVAENGLRQLRIVQGKMDDADMAALYRSCDCFVFPSRGEGTGLPLFEAMACGLPVISTFCSGHTQLLENFSGQYFRVDAARKLTHAPDFLKWYRWADGPGDWYEPCVDSLANAMHRAAKRAFPWDPVETALAVRQQFCWDNSADAALNALLSDRLALSGPTQLLPYQ